jgi:hypothetical protein
MKRSIAIVLVPWIIFACGGEPPAKAPEATAPAAPPPKAATKPKLNMSQELGEIDPKKADAAVKAAHTSVTRCQTQGHQRLDFMSGEVKFFVRLGPDGAVKWAYLEDSSLGDRETEKCILQALRAAPWPKPEGGDAEVRNGFVLGASDAREPASWGADKIAAALGKAKAELDKCTAGTKGSFRVTGYVEPDGKEGKFSAVGVAPPNKEGEAQVDCIVGALRSIKLPSPGSYAAKVSFSL